MTKHIFESSFIDACDYDEKEKCLTVEMRSGQSYTYEGVSPDDFEAFKSAKSPGQFFQLIKGNYDLKKDHK
jgi:hypothetical protein